MGDCVLIICNCGFDEFELKDASVEFDGKLNDGRQFATGGGTFSTSSKVSLVNAETSGDKFIIHPGGSIMISCTDVFSPSTVSSGLGQLAAEKGYMEITLTHASGSITDKWAVSYIPSIG